MLMTTPWHEFDGGRVRIALQTEWGNSAREGVVEVSLKPDWKTYWQNPGNSGMAPELLFDQKVDYHIMFPVPRLFHDGVDWSIGYKNGVLFPFRVEKNDNVAALSGRLMIGICKEICMPLDIPFNFSAGQADIGVSDALLTLAKDQLPKEIPDNYSITANGEGKNLTIIITHPEKSTITALYLDGGKDEIGPAEIVSRTPSKTIFKAAIIFSSGKRPLEINYIADGEPVSFSGTVVSFAKH